MKKTKSQEFLEELVKKVGGEIYDEGQWARTKDGRAKGAGIGRSNRAYFTYKDLPFEVDFYSQREITIQVNLKPSYKIFIGHKKFLTRIFSFGIKVGNPNFDKKYNLQYITPEKAKELVNQGFIDNLSKLEPFVAIKLTRKEYLLLKDVKFPQYTVEQAIQDFDLFINFYNQVKNLDNSK